MADPILNDFFRAQVVLKGKSGLAEDVYVNNFVFRNDQGVVADVNDAADAIAARLSAFYTTPGANGARVGQYLSGRAIQQQAEIRVYDLGQAPPRMPHVRPLDLGALSGTGLPEEVALCLSYYAGRPLPRRRGRIYVGPLADTAVQTGTGNVEPHPSFRQTLAQAAAGLASQSATAQVRWHLLSQTDQSAHMITGGWIDNAFDTQRRRGSKATARTTWGAPPAS